MSQDFYNPGTHQGAEDLLRKTARRLGVSLKFNSCGDWLCYRTLPGKRRAKPLGVIVNINSYSNPGVPSPIATRSICETDELEDLRHELNQVLMSAGYLDASEDSAEGKEANHANP